MQPLWCAVGILEPALGAAARLGSLFVRETPLLNAGPFQMWRCCSVTTAYRALPVCVLPALGMAWATARSNAASAMCSSVLELELGAAGRLGRWFMGGAVLLNAGLIQMMWRRCSATTAHRALPVCVWAALGMSWATARSFTVFEVCSRCVGACTWCCCRAGQVICGGCGFAECWTFPDVKALFSSHSAQSPASV